MNGIMKKLLCVLLWAFMLLGCSSNENPNLISLSGEWQFQMDTLDIGVTEAWYARDFDDSIQLPGSMMEYGKGFEPTLETRWTGSIYDSSFYYDKRYEKYRQEGDIKFPFWLTPPKHYAGPAWYSREITIPKQWSNNKIELNLERPHWETTVWVNSKQAGSSQRSLSTPHKYDLTDLLSPGKHRLTIRVDNRVDEVNVGPDSHSLTDHTQGNWNGIVGDLELKASPQVHIAAIKLYPDVETKSVKAVIDLRNMTGRAISGELHLSALSFNTDQIHEVPVLTTPFQGTGDSLSMEIEYKLGEEVQLWDEFNPALYQLTADLYVDVFESTHRFQEEFGMREFTVEGTRFAVNGRPVFLRGTLDCAGFPLTGYPPTEIPEWEEIFKTVKEHGLNHVRYHSWCPPKAAFQAADRVGIYLQPEAASWPNHGITVGDGQPIDEYLMEETNQILDAYGNHASFVMMAAGNEPGGANQVEYLNDYVNHWQDVDPRRLYTGASIGMSWPVVPESDFLVRSGPRGLKWKDGTPGTMFDHYESIKNTEKPYVAHENGQYNVFPDFREIDKYTGVYQAKNFELFRALMEENGMKGKGHDFMMASGKLQSIMYKAEIEAALRTPGFAGFQLLDLNDFPGQGTALIGVLNAFWEEKGYISPEEFRRFSGVTVPLVRTEKFVWENDETFQASAEVSHFGPKPLNEVTARWKITRDNGEEVASGSFDTRTIPLDNTIALGTIKLNLSAFNRAQRLNLEINVADHANDWDFWVFPADPPEPEIADIYITDSLDARAESILNDGGKVFIDAAGKVQYGKDIVQYFRPVFWNTSWFQMNPPHTLGIYLNPEHPAFEDFPTEYHSNYQWFDILDRQQVMWLEGFPDEFEPLVQPIDTYHLNRKLGLVLEAKVGNGKLIMSSTDLTNRLNERPVARQLRQSLIKYMGSENFDPQYSVEMSVIEDIFRKQSERLNFYTNESTDDLKPETQN